MIAIPAVDLREGCCVQLVGGSFADERIRLDDPLGVARTWLAAGFRRLHVVDLDAALDLGDNTPVIEALCGLRGAEIQVGGGIRDRDQVARLIELGAARVVVGTRALEDPEWLDEIARAWPDRIVVAADAMRGAAVARGWTATLDRRAVDVVAELTALPLAGFLVTAVDREGLMAGPDLTLVAEVASVTRRPVMASGGIGNADDLRALANAGASAAVIGMALYTGALDARAVAQEFHR